jgi:hypothetical protein
LVKYIHDNLLMSALQTNQTNEIITFGLNIVNDIIEHFPLDLYKFQILFIN